MSWESSLEYYRIINEQVKEKLGGLWASYRRVITLTCIGAAGAVVVWWIGPEAAYVAVFAIGVLFGQQMEYRRYHGIAPLKMPDLPKDEKELLDWLSGADPGADSKSSPSKFQL